MSVSNTESDLIYRFRSIDKVLSNDDLQLKNGGGRDELRKQQLYFSPLNSLNDPMEGFKNIYWQGDEIVWRNFIRHYIMCLEQVFALFILDRSCPLTSEDIPVFKRCTNFPTDMYKKCFEEIVNLFFSHPHLSKYPHFFGQCRSKIKKDEMQFYLEILHFHALSCISIIYVKYGLLANPLFQNNDTDKTIPSVDQLKAIQDHNSKSNAREQLFAVARSVLEQEKLKIFLTNQNAEQNSIFVFLNFSGEYLKRLEKLLYPETYLACFSKSYTNSSMWSHYAKDHEGICFQFKTDISTLKLNKITGYSGSKGKELKANYSNVTATPKDVRYLKKYPEIDFFKSLGNLPTPQLTETWLSNGAGKLSKTASYLDFDKSDSWRTNYWKRHEDIMMTKTLDWKYEEEIRLTLHSLLSDGNEISKNVSYDFENLDGIIFGMNTKNHHKIKIVEIIKIKCAQANRSDFKFYQAYYCNKSGKIEKAPLNL